ncbi:MAG: hypothetical protein WDZ77_01265 [Candidatus Pacearchaeota archaeon]
MARAKTPNQLDAKLKSLKKEVKKVEAQHKKAVTAAKKKTASKKKTVKKTTKRKSTAKKKPAKKKRR